MREGKRDGREKTMRCVDCEKHSFVANTHWCDATNRPKRVSDEDAYKDAPCKRGKLKGADDERSNHKAKQ